MSGLPGEITRLTENENRHRFETDQIKRCLYARTIKNLQNYYRLIRESNIGRERLTQADRQIDGRTDGEQERERSLRRRSGREGTNDY